MAVRRTSELRQAELVDAALAIIATRGIAALTTRSLAEQVGLTTGAIFRHFATLDDLLDAVVDRVEHVLDETYPDPGLAPRARLEQFVEARTTAIAERRGIIQLVVSEQFRLALPARASTRLAACVQKSREFVERCIREAQAAGELRADLEPRALAIIVMGTMQMLARSKASGGQVVGVREGLFTLLEPSGVRRTSGGRKTS